MKSAQLYAEAGLRGYAVVLDKGDEAVERITDFAGTTKLRHTCGNVSSRPRALR